MSTDDKPLRQEEYRAMAEEVRRARATAADAERRAQVSQRERRILDVLRAFRMLFHLTVPSLFGLVFGLSVGAAVGIVSDRWGGWNFLVGPSVELNHAAHNLAGQRTRPVPKQPR